MKVTVNSFLKYYQTFESRPVFGTVEEMLQWAGLYNLTTRTLHEELIDVGLSSLLIQELATVRILPDSCTNSHEYLFIDKYMMHMAFFLRWNW